MRDEGNEKEINEGTPSRSSPTDSKQISRSDYLYKVAITSILIVSFSVEVISTSKRYNEERTSLRSQCRRCLADHLRKSLLYTLLYVGNQRARRKIRPYHPAGTVSNIP